MFTGIHVFVPVRFYFACELKRTRVLDQTVLWGYVNNGWGHPLGNILGTEKPQLCVFAITIARIHPSLEPAILNLSLKTKGG